MTALLHRAAGDIPLTVDLQGHLNSRLPQYAFFLLHRSPDILIGLLCIRWRNRNERDSYSGKKE
jgi:hypothetical protein